MRLFSLISGLMMICTLTVSGQTRKHTNAQFTYLIHDSFTDTILNGEQVFMDNTIFLDLDEVGTYDNAFKYMDALEYKLMDNWKTEPGVGVLGGVPVLTLHTVKENGTHDFVQDYYIWDNGKKVYSLSIAGFAMDARVNAELFPVTKDSFTFITTRNIVGHFYMDVPKIMGSENNMIWSRIHRPDEWLEMVFRYFKNEEEAAEKNAAEWRKIFKKEKYRERSDTTYTVNGINVTRLMGTHDKKLTKTVEPETAIIYLLSNSAGSHTSFTVRIPPQLAPMVFETMNKMVSTVSTERY